MIHTLTIAFNHCLMFDVISIQIKTVVKLNVQTYRYIYP